MMRQAAPDRARDEERLFRHPASIISRAIDCLFEVIDVDNILSPPRCFGAVKGIDPETGHNFDDTKRYIDALPTFPRPTRRRCSKATPGGSTPALDRMLKARGFSEVCTCAHSRHAIDFPPINCESADTPYVATAAYKGDVP